MASWPPRARPLAANRPIVYAQTIGGGWVFTPAGEAGARLLQRLFPPGADRTYVRDALVVEPRFAVDVAALIRENNGLVKPGAAR